MQGIYGRKMDNWHQMSYMVQGGLDLSPVITHRFHYTQFEEVKPPRRAPAYLQIPAAMMPMGPAPVISTSSPTRFHISAVWVTLQGIYGRKMDNWHQMSYMVQGGLDLSPVITHQTRQLSAKCGLLV